MMVSVDGYFEGVNHDISWHNVDKEFSTFVHEQNLGPTGAILMGHRTYDLMAGFWPKEEGMKEDPETARWMNETPKFVATRAPFTPAWASVTVLSGDVVAEVATLKAQPGKDIVILGSNELCVSLMEKGLVDEFRLMVNPVALGAGTQLFAGLSKRINVTLTSTREFKSGNVLNCYVLK